MQTKIRSRIGAGLLTLVTLSVTSLAFSLNPGGEHFEIYLNKKLVLQQMVSQGASTKSVVLNEQHENEQIDVFYSHCGQIGTRRIILLKDGNNVLKQWRFTDAGSPKFMSLRAGDIVALQSKRGNSKLNLVYISEQLPEGKLLAMVILGAKSTNKTNP